MSPHNAFGINEPIGKSWREKLVAAKTATTKGAHAKPAKPNLALRPLSTLKAIATAKK